MPIFWLFPEKGGIRVEILTAKELGRHLKLSESTIYKLAAKGDIPGFKIGDSWRFDMEEIQSLIQEAKKERKNKKENR